MNPVSNNLLILAERIRCRLPRQHTREDFCDALQDCVLPMVRCALRSGVGHDHLVEWVLHQAEYYPLALLDPVKAAPPIARTLAERLMELPELSSGRKTIAGP